jgi:hypothetical protein
VVFRAVAQTLRPISEGAMPDTVQVIRETWAEDSEGFDRPTESVVATTKGRYRTATARDLERAGRVASQVEGVMTIPLSHGAPGGLQDEDRLTRAGKTYHVRGVLEQSEDLAADLQVLVSEAS